MSIHAQPPGRRALAVTVVAGALAAALALTTDQASAAYTAQVQAGTLQITGDAASDTLAAAARGTGHLQVSVNGVPAFSFDAATFTAIDVKAGAGDDVVTGSNGIASLGRLTIDGGAGDDTLAGGDGDDVLIGGPGNDLVDGNRGNDTALLGAGADHFQWDPGDGSDTVEGEGGKDVMDFNGSNAGENIDVSANGSRVRLFRDVAAITMDFAGIEGLTSARWAALTPSPSTTSPAPTSTAPTSTSAPSTAPATAPPTPSSPTAPTPPTTSPSAPTQARTSCPAPRRR